MVIEWGHIGHIWNRPVFVAYVRDSRYTRELLDEAGRMKGSALVMEFSDRAALDAYLNNEPYVVEGVWQKIEVENMNVVLVNGEKRQ